LAAASGETGGLLPRLEMGEVTDSLVDTRLSMLLELSRRTRGASCTSENQSQEKEVVTKCTEHFGSNNTNNVFQC